MINTLRNSTNSIFAKAFMIIFAFSFLAWGATSQFTNTPKSIAMTVNGEEVPVTEVQREYDFRLKEAERQLGGKLTPELIQSIRLGNRTINNIITSKLTLDESKNLGFRASEKALKKQITETTSFHDETGKFNKDVYKHRVQSYGYSVKGYEALIASEMQKKDLYSVFATEFNSKDYLNKLYNYQNEKLVLRALHVKDNALGKLPTPTAAEIKDFYDENSYLFQTEETRDFNTLVLRAADLKDRTTVTAEEILATYNDNPESFASEEERRASHILVATEEKAVELVDKLDAGTAFEEIAKAESTDTFTSNKGGDLGYFFEGDMVEAFSDTAYSMAVGDISEPVKSPFGYHIIKLTGVKEATPRSFDEVKDEIKSDLQAEQSEDLYFDMLENVEDLIAGGSTLNDIATTLKLELNVHEQLKRNNTSMTFATSVMPVAYELEENAISEAVAIEGQDTVSVFVEVSKVMAPRPLTINEAQNKIVKSLNVLNRQKLLTSKAEKLLVERQKAKSLTAVAAKNGMTKSLETLTSIGRTGNGAPKWLKPLHVTILFTMENGDNLSNLINTPEGMALVELVNVEKDEPTEEDLEFFQKKVSSEIQADLFATYMLKKRKEANIDLNIPSLEYALGNAFVAE